jgi:carbon-monoxide dehydrogenase medium subunit
LVKARAFHYERPRSAEEALRAFAAAEDALYIAGGQSLVPAMALRLQAPDLLVDIARLPELQGLSVEGSHLRIGGATRHAEILTSPLVRQHAPLLAEAAPHVAHPAIRNKGTFAGSLALADPAAEFPAMALALDAEIEIMSLSGTRRVPAGDFFIDLYETALEPGELIVAVHVPVAGPGTRCAFDELARRRGDFAIVGLGIDARFENGLARHIRLAFLSMGATAIRARTAEAGLIGRPLDHDAIREAQAALEADLSPAQDEETPAEMRLHLARVLLGRLLGRIMQ